MRTGDGGICASAQGCVGRLLGSPVSALRVVCELVAPPPGGEVMRLLPEPSEPPLQPGQALTVLDGAGYEVALTTADGTALATSALPSDAWLIVRSARGTARWRLPDLRPYARLRAGSETLLLWPAACAAVVSPREGRVWLIARVELERYLADREVAGLIVGLLPSAALASAGPQPGAPRSPLAAVPMRRHTALEGACVPLHTGRDRAALLVVAKGTFALVDGERAAPAEQPRLLQGEPADPSACSPDDFAPLKPEVDVLLHGAAFPRPGARAAKIELLLAGREVAFAVFGPRTYDRIGAPSEPAPFDELALGWASAAGGPDNPLGSTDAPPRLEDPANLTRSRSDRRRPTCPTAVPRGVMHRATPTATFDAAWRDAVWPALPRDFDATYFQAAEPRMRWPRLRGDESFRLTSVREGGEGWSGSLPGVRPRAFALRSGTAPEELALRLDTVMFDTARGELVLTWRGQCQTAPLASDVEAVVLLEEPLAEPLSDDRVAALLRAPAERAQGPRARPDHNDEAPAWRLAAPVAPALAGLPARLLPSLPALLRSRSTIEREEVIARLAEPGGLRGVDLSRADLRELDLTGADLSGALLTGADLRGARLAKVVARGLRALGVDARGVSFEGADLERALFAAAQLVGCDFSGATLRGADFADAELGAARFVDASARQMRLLRARADGLVADRLQGERLDASGASLRGASLREACLCDARFDGVVAPDLVLDRAQLQRSRWERASLPGASLVGASLGDAALELADLQRANLGGAELSGALLAGARLIGASLAGALARRALFVGADLEGASLAGADLMRAKLDHCRLRSAVFSAANVFEATFHGASDRPG